MEILIVACIIVIGFYHFTYSNTKKERDFYKFRCINAYKKIYNLDAVRVENELSRQYHEKVSNN